ncbi:hypothetical protein K439DRAFT_454140 [Ramaria rubella]|nr:hypothetical protein K439DRAFT_454140 [Ramaria rubella]
MPRPNLYRDFLLIYILLTAARAFPRLASKKGARKIIQLLIHRGKDPEILKEALFVVLLPRSCSLWYHWYPDSVLPTILSSPLLQLVEPSLRRTLAVYVATTAATNFGRDSTHRRHLPPTWTLILIANSWLLWAFLFQRECFPHRYGDLILRHSGYGSGEPTENLVHFLQQTKFEIYPPGVLSSTSSTEIQIHPAHTRAVCARLHPTTPSCLRTYVKAWLTQFPQVFKWVGVFSGLAYLFNQGNCLHCGYNQHLLGSHLLFSVYFTSGIPLTFPEIFGYSYYLHGGERNLLCIALVSPWGVIGTCSTKEAQSMGKPSYLPYHGQVCNAIGTMVMDRMAWQAWF